MEGRYVDKPFERGRLIWMTHLGIRLEIMRNATAVSRSRCKQPCKR